MKKTFINLLAMMVAASSVWGAASCDDNMRYVTAGSILGPNSSLGVANGVLGISFGRVSGGQTIWDGPGIWGATGAGSALIDASIYTVVGLSWSTNVSFGQPPSAGWTKDIYLWDVCSNAKVPLYGARSYAQPTDDHFQYNTGCGSLISQVTLICSQNPEADSGHPVVVETYADAGCNFYFFEYAACGANKSVVITASSPATSLPPACAGKVPDANLNADLVVPAVTPTP
jgi:hypothetical protein